MRVLFPYPQAYGYFPDIAEYVTALRRSGVDARYAGVQRGQAATDLPPYASEMPGGPSGTRQFIDYVGDQIEALKPDVVHAFHFRGCGALPLLAGRGARRWVVDVRTIHVETRDLRIASDFWLRDRLTWLETQTYDYVLALTETIRRKLRPSVRPVKIVPLGASASKLNPEALAADRDRVRADLGIPADAPVILYAGSLSPTRQIDKIIRALALIAGKWPAARLLVVGGEVGQRAAADPSVERLGRLAVELGIDCQVLFTGRVSFEAMPTYFAAADIGVSFMPLGTPHQFQPPTKLLEYMMAGIVPLSNRIPAVDGLVADGVNGLLFGDAEPEIAAGLERALALLRPESADARRRLTASAVDSVRARDWQHLVDTHLIPLYEQLQRS